MPKINIISDIHFDSGLNGKEENSTKSAKRTPFGAYFNKNLQQLDCDVTLIAGDLASSLKNTELFLNTFYENKNVIFIDGNHLVYNKENKSIYQLKDELRKAFPKNHMFWHYLENDWMWIPNSDKQVAIIGSTFYTDYEYTKFTVDTYNDYKKAVCDSINLFKYGNIQYTPVKKLTKKMIINENLLLAEDTLNDFYWGKETDTTKLTPQTYLKLHKIAKEKIIQCYNEIITSNPNAKVILMTHHCLSEKCIDEKYINSRSNANYVSNLEKWLCNTMPNLRLVISGHVHCRKDFYFGKDNKRYILNPCGYIYRCEPFISPKFNPILTLNTNEF